MKILLCLLLLAYSTIVAAEEPRLNEAAVHALKEAFNSPRGTEFEYGGILVLQDRKIYWTNPPHTDFLIDANTTNPKKMLMPGQTLLGVYHTHPCLPNTHLPGYFSMVDVAFAIYQNVPGFILDECTGNVQKFDPNKDSVESLTVEVKFDLPFGAEPVIMHMVKGPVIGNIGQRGPIQD